jgi:hypothetical protein
VATLAEAKNDVAARADVYLGLCRPRREFVRTVNAKYACVAPVLTKELNHIGYVICAANGQIFIIDIFGPRSGNAGFVKYQSGIKTILTSLSQ